MGQPGGTRGLPHADIPQHPPGSAVGPRTWHGHQPGDGSERGRCPTAGSFHGTKGNNTRSGSSLQPAAVPGAAFEPTNGSRAQKQPVKTGKGKNKYCESGVGRNQLRPLVATSGCRGRNGRGSISPPPRAARVPLGSIPAASPSRRRVTSSPS